MRESFVYLGLDLGSVSLNTVVLDEQFSVIEEHYDFTRGRPFQVLYDRLQSLLQKFPSDVIRLAAITGSGGKLAADLVGGAFINEVIAQATAVSRLYPETRTVIEIGGEDSKLILLDRQPGESYPRLVDFEMNSICAAGTGSFLDQQARRIGLSIENEFGRMALKSNNPPRIAGRCSVFAKSDMIHLQQIATPLHDIVAGLCFALARNFRSTIAHGKEMQKPVVFCGGVAANEGMVRAFREVLELKNGDLVIPDHFASTGAIGAVIHALESGLSKSFLGIEKLEKYIHRGGTEAMSLPKLPESSAKVVKAVQYKLNGEPELPVYLGLDIGSLSTNLVLITEDHKVVERLYLPTAGKPIEAIQKGLTEIFEHAGDRVKVMGAGTTGSGRYLTGDFIGADVIINEITAQATAAIDIDPAVDTIFEIGGQDSKYISIKNGVIVDFEMNKVCAAGTGSFLEEQAEKLGISIIDQFGKLALECDCPAKLGDRCTVFMESDLNSLQQKGTQVDRLVGGLAYSIVNNYIEKVVGPRKIGEHISFQGGVANNRSVIAAFEQVTGHKIMVPPNFDVTGAIGAAILAKQYIKKENQTTRFKGFHMRDVPYTSSRFDCKACTNHCEIRKVVIDGEKKPLFYGGRCEKYETSDRKKTPGNIPDLFARRLEFLQNGYNPVVKQGQKTIGIPRALMVYYQQFPFWRTFFESLGFSVKLSRESDKELVTRSLETITTEVCLPVELLHGHVTDLFSQGADYIFLPFIADGRKKEGNPTTNCNCPWIQSHPFMVRAALRSTCPVEKILTPVLHFGHFDTALRTELVRFASETLGAPKAGVHKAIKLADEAQLKFEQTLQQYGKKVLADIPQGCKPVVLLGRPYNTCDPYLNLGLVEKLIRHDLMPIPLDFLQLDINSIFKDYRSMYWPNGQKILAAARIVAEDARLYAIYMGNFRCGPDSFIMHYVEEELKGKPCLHLEVDEHSADAGMITRIEAYVESLRGFEFNRALSHKKFTPRPGPAYPVKERVLYFPYMNDSAHAISAAARSCGIQSEVLPLQDEGDLETGRKYTSSRECFPMICTTGSFIRKLREPGVDPAKVSFFMPDHNGPCRFGQYNHLQRILFDKLGYEKAEIVCPSNDSSYADIAGKSAAKFRFNAWKGFVAVDFLRKLRQETRPYEICRGETDRVYQTGLDQIIHCIEQGAHGLDKVLHGIVIDFRGIAVDKSLRKPLVAIIGEIFMRDNNFCNGRLISRLETLGVETLIAPFSEWITYSTYRYKRDSIWKKDLKGYLKAQFQGIVQEISSRKLTAEIMNSVDHSRIPHLHEILERCEPYVHRDYDGDPPLAMGTSAFLFEKGISGIAAILPFTCMPGTLVSAVSDSFRKDHDNIPWINVAYDGQDNISLDTRLQAFVHQVKEWKSSHAERSRSVCSKSFEVL